MICQFSADLVIEHAHLGISPVSKKIHDRINVISLLIKIVQRNKFSFLVFTLFLFLIYILTAENESCDCQHNSLSQLNSHTYDRMRNSPKSLYRLKKLFLTFKSIIEFEILVLVQKLHSIVNIVLYPHTSTNMYACIFYHMTIFTYSSIVLVKSFYIKNNN